MSEEFISNADSENHDMISPILGAILEEMKEFSKRKQDLALNKLKVKMINKILTQAKDILKNEPTKEFLDLLDEETLPTNSDAVLVISQFQAALKQYKAKNSVWDREIRQNRWQTQENP